MPAHGERRAGQGSACSGTGVIIDERGYIVTCHHVVTGADAVFVKLEDGRRFVAKAINSDPFTDLAVLRIEGAGHLTVATLAPSDKLDVGDWVVSVGTPYGLANSVSAGIVSAVDREIPEVPRTRLIQTDAASNPGNSGGDLINLKGELIGITEGSYGASEAFQGITFAIPSDVVKDVVHKLIEHGEVRRAYLGCHTESLTPDIAVCVGLTNTQGVIVTKVAADAPAVHAGIQSGDVLLRFDEASIVDGKVMQEFVEAAVPGRGYTLTCHSAR
jgi:serine protease Do